MENKKRKQKKLKLKASARDNRRYLLVNEKSNEVIEKAILDYIGILGFAKAGYVFVDKDGNNLVCSVKRESLNDVRAALGMMGIRVENVSGTLRGLER